MEGEQFAVLLPGLSLAATERAARRLREAAATRARVAGLDLEVTLTIGVAAAPVHGTDSGTLMQRADVALLAAADSGGVASYHPVLDQQSLRRLQLGTELEQAMADGQISVVFQPIIDAQTSDIVSVETLVRWAHPRYGSIPPDDFIHLAEQIGRIGAVTDHVLELALARCRRWLDQDIALSVAVNLSVHCLTEPDLVSPGPPGTAAPRRPRRAAHPRTDRGQRRRRLRAGQQRARRPARARACDCPWTTSAPATRRCRSCGSCRSTRSRSTSPSCSACPPARGSPSSPGRSSSWPTTWACASWPRASRTSCTRNLLAEMGCDKLQGFLVSRPLPDDRLESWLLARTGVRSAGPGCHPPEAVRPHLRKDLPAPHRSHARGGPLQGGRGVSGRVSDGSSSTPL